MAADRFEPSRPGHGLLLAKLSLDRDSPVPLYHQLEGQIQRLIKNGQLKSGALLPGDLELAHALNINPRTVRHALQRLVTQGLIHRIQKAGTFVSRDVSGNQGVIGFFYFEEAQVLMRKYIAPMRTLAARHHYKLLVNPFARNFFQTHDVPGLIAKKKLSGAIITTMADQACLATLKQLQSEGFAHVRLTNSHFHKQLHSPLVQADWNRAITQILRYFWASGHRRIGVIYTGGKPIAAIYNEFARAHGGFPDRWQLSIPSDGTLEMLHSLDSVRHVRDYLTNNQDVTAVCATIMSRELIQAAREQNRRVPQDLAVISMGLNKSVHGLKLSTMKVDTRQMGHMAMQRVLELINRPDPKASDVTEVPFDYVPGDTFLL